MIRVFIVAASSLARAGLQSLAANREVEVVGSAATLEPLGGQWADVVADVVLIEASGEQLAAAVESLAASVLASETAIVILAERTDSKLLSDALRAGVRAILPTEISADQLLRTLQAAAVGLTVMHPSEIGAMFPASQSGSPALAELAEPLTPRESEVLQMLASGLGNKEIAARLAISEHTVKFHVASILGKLGAGTRTEAVALGIRRGLVLL